MRRLFAFVLFLLLVSPSALGGTARSGSFVGQQAPQVVIDQWISQQPEVKGKWLLVDFWTTWCSPCVQGIPDLNRFHQRFKSQLVVIGLSSEKRESVERMKKPAIYYYHGVDPKGRTKKLLGIRGIPHVVIIDPQGVVRWQGNPVQPGSKLTEEVIAGLLARGSDSQVVSNKSTRIRVSSCGPG